MPLVACPAVDLEIGVSRINGLHHLDHFARGALASCGRRKIITPSRAVGLVTSGALAAQCSAEVMHRDWNLIGLEILQNLNVLVFLYGQLSGGGGWLLRVQHRRKHKSGSRKETDSWGKARELDHT